MRSRSHRKTDALARSVSSSKNGSGAAETFYWLDRRVRGQGVAAEALDVATRWAFDEHKIVRAHLVTHLDNPASQRVAQRCGYQREGVLRAWEPIKDDQPDLVMWSRLVSDPAPDLSPS